MISIGDCFAFGDKARAWAKANALPVFDKVELGGIPPEAIAITGDIGALLTGDSIRDLDKSRYLDDSNSNGWCHELRLRLWLKNVSSKLLCITGISPNKQVVDCDYNSAVMFPPQGVASGDVVRFECNLDTDLPSMRRFNLEGGQRIFSSSEYYFDEGMLEVDPDHSVCISFYFMPKRGRMKYSPSSS